MIIIITIERNRKKTLTEEEQALKRSEVARRRKHQSAQRAEKDKVHIHIISIMHTLKR